MIVTDGVLAGETRGFPLLYHWRVLPGRSPVAAEHADVDAAVAALGGSPAVRARLEALATASRSLVLFCEYIPHPMGGWLSEDPASMRRTTPAMPPCNLVNWLATAVCGVAPPASDGAIARNEYVLRCASGHLPDSVPPAVAAILARHAAVAARMNSFYWRLFVGDVHAEYPGG